MIRVTQRGDTEWQRGSGSGTKKEEKTIAAERERD